VQQDVSGVADVLSQTGQEDWLIWIDATAPSTLRHFGRAATSTACMAANHGTWAAKGNIFNF